jgi:hypothetical protein
MSAELRPGWNWRSQTNRLMPRSACHREARRAAAGHRVSVDPRSAERCVARLRPTHRRRPAPTVVRPGTMIGRDFIAPRNSLASPGLSVAASAAEATGASHDGAWPSNGRYP